MAMVRGKVRDKGERKGEGKGKRAMTRKKGTMKSGRKKYEE